MQRILVLNILRSISILKRIAFNFNYYESLIFMQLSNYTQHTTIHCNINVPFYCIIIKLKALLLNCKLWLYNSSNKTILPLSVRVYHASWSIILYNLFFFSFFLYMQYNISIFSYIVDYWRYNTHHDMMACVRAKRVF